MSISTETLNFLETYGYLPPTDENSQSLVTGHQMRMAIQTMQKYANIPQTGVIDAQTEKVMRWPRCGMADVDSNGSSTRSKRFVSYGAKWKKFPLTWSFVNSSRTVPDETARSTFAKALELWSRASTKLEFIETSDPNADIRIGFYVGEHGCGKRQAFDGPGIKLAHAFGPPDGDVHFDDDENWLDGKDGLSLYWTALHEFGHSLGFSHTADESSIMFPYYQDHGNNFELPEIDKAGVFYLYGGSNNNEENALPSLDANRENINVVTQTTPSLTDEPEETPCYMNIDAIASIRGDIFVFKNNTFWWIKKDLQLVRQEPILISHYFAGFPPEIKRVDAVYERKSDHKIMFFTGNQFWLFSANQYYDGPKPLTTLGLPHDLDKVDAVTNWGHNRHAYIFAGPIYWRLDDNEKYVLIDYPRDISVWRGVPMYIDAAFTWEFDSATYFFKGIEYWKFDNQHMRTNENYPKRIATYWFRELNCETAQNYKFNQRSFNSSPDQLNNILYTFITMQILNYLIR